MIHIETKRHAHSLVGCGVVFLIAAGLTACAPSPASSNPVVSATATATGSFVEGSAVVPYETLSDWASYADAIIIARVASIDREADVDSETNLQLRDVDAVVSKVLWASPLAARKIDNQVTFNTGHGSCPRNGRSDVCTSPMP